MENMQIDPKGGGTNFSDAFKQAAYCFDQTKSNYLPVIIFMTDGEGSTTESEAYLKDMFKKNNKLLTFTIGFGRDCN
jgi:Mg-chelatase subunit ChlD